MTPRFESEYRRSSSTPRQATIVVEGSLGGGPGSWFAISDEITFSADTSDLIGLDVDVPVVFIRARLVHDVEPSTPLVEPAPVISETTEQNADGGTTITSTIVEAPPTPRSPYGITAWLSAA